MGGRVILRKWKSLLAVVMAVSAISVLGSTPATAGEAGRHCATYYHLENPALGGYTVCVKLEHDPTLGWRTNASVTTTTPGMVLHTATVELWSEGTIRATGSKPAAVSQILGIVSDWYDFCEGSHPWIGKEIGFVTWPDGTNSPSKQTNTDTVTGPC